MKPILRCFFISICITLLPSLYLYSQEYDSSEDCCDEYYLGDTSAGMDYDEWSRQIGEELNKVNRLLAEINLLNREIDSLREISFAKDKSVTEAENELYSAVGSNKKGIDDFRIKFKECEKMITDCKDAESAERIRKSCFNDIEASRIKCLPEFWERYLMMKKKLEECSGKVLIEEKTGNYTVVKGDCLWKISAKREIYGNGRLWPKIWEANKNGVISAPSRIPKTIKNPNLIYPGQVLRIPVMSEAEKKMELNKAKEIKKKRKKKNE